METNTKLVGGLIFLIFAVVGTTYFYPYYVGTDYCYADGSYGLWENASELQYFNDTFPAIGRYWCAKEAKITKAQCEAVEPLVNVKGSGCLWGGKTSGSKKMLYVMEDPELPVINNYTIIGNSVEWENVHGKVVVTPHTITTLSDGCFEVEATSYIPTQDIDCAIASDSGKLKAKNAFLWANISHDVPETYYENETQYYTCTGSFNYTLSPKYAWCYDLVNGSLMFEHSFEGGDIPSKTIWWNELKPKIRYVQEYWNDWQNINSKFNKVTLDKDYFVITNIPWQQNAMKKVKFCFDAKIDKQKNGWGINEKMDIFCKRSADTIEEAMSSGNMFIVDPWWNAGYLYKRNDSFTGNYVYYNIASNTIQNVWTINSSASPVPYLVNSTGFQLGDYAIVYRNESSQPPYEVSYGNVTSLNPNNVWDSNYVHVLHMDELSGNYTDSTVNGLNQNFGTINRTSGKYASGQGTGLMSFAVTSPENIFNSSSYTFEVWIKNKGGVGDYGFLADKRAAGTGTHHAIYLMGASNQIQMDATWGGATRILNGPFTLASQTWYHIGVTYNVNGSGVIYVNGNDIGATWDIMPSGAPDQAKNNMQCYKGQGAACPAVSAASNITMDEIRWSKIARPAEYFKKVFSQSNSTLGAEEGTPNTAPTTPDPTFNPSIAYNLTDLNCSVGTYINDAEADAMTVYFNLTINNVHKTQYILTSQANGTQPSWIISHTNYSKGNNVSCWITLNDGTASSGTNTTSLTISNSPPVFNETHATVSTTAGQQTNLTYNCKDNDTSDTLVFSSNATAYGKDSFMSGRELSLNPSYISIGSWILLINCSDGTVSDNTSTAWAVSESVGGGGDPLCVQYLQVDSFTGIEIEYNLTVQCVNPKADANYTVVTITPYTDFGSAATISIAANSTNQTSFYNTTQRGTSDGAGYTIDGAAVTGNITMTTNAIDNFIPIDPPYAFTKDGIVDCDQGMYANKIIELAFPLTFRGAGDFLVSAILKATGIKKEDTDCRIVINESGRMEVG